MHCTMTLTARPAGAAHKIHEVQQICALTRNTCQEAVHKMLTCSSHPSAQVCKALQSRSHLVRDEQGCIGDHLSTRGGKVLQVFGAGGKRPIAGSNLASRFIVANDPGYITAQNTASECIASYLLLQQCRPHKLKTIISLAAAV